VLGNDPRILDRHVPTVEIHHFGAEPAVDWVERGFADSGRGFDWRQDGPRSLGRGWAAEQQTEKAIMT